MNYPLPVPPPFKPTRWPANRRDCIVGRNRKMRKKFCRELWTGKFSRPLISNDTIWAKKLRREARHNMNAFELAESMGLYGNHNYE